MNKNCVLLDMHIVSYLMESTLQSNRDHFPQYDSHGSEIEAFTSYSTALNPAQVTKTCSYLKAI